MLRIGLIIALLTGSHAMAAIVSTSAGSELQRGMRDGYRCAPIKESLDLVECINAAQAEGRKKATDAAAYVTGIALACWDLQDTIFRSLNNLEQTPRVLQAIKVSHDMSIAAFVGARNNIKSLGLTEDQVLDTAGFNASDKRARWSYWLTQPVPAWLAAQTRAP